MADGRTRDGGIRGERNSPRDHREHDGAARSTPQTPEQPAPLALTDSGLGFQAKTLRTFQGVPSLLGSGMTERSDGRFGFPLDSFTLTYPHVCSAMVGVPHRPLLPSLPTAGAAEGASADGAKAVGTEAGKAGGATDAGAGRGDVRAAMRAHQLQAHSVGSLLLLCYSQA